MTTTKSKTF